MLFYKFLTKKKERNLFACFFLNFITVVAEFAKCNMSLGFKDIVSPLDEFIPNGGGSF